MEKANRQFLVKQAVRDYLQEHERVEIELSRLYGTSD